MNEDAVRNAGGEVAGTFGIAEPERLTGSGALSEQENDVLLGVVELEVLEDDQLDAHKAVTEPAANWLRVVDRQQLGRKDHGQPARGLEERTGVDQGSGPR